MEYLTCGDLEMIREQVAVAYSTLYAGIYLEEKEISTVYRSGVEVLGMTSNLAPVWDSSALLLIQEPD
jgi:hypothetical protein